MSVVRRVLSIVILGAAAVAGWVLAAEPRDRSGAEGVAAAQPDTEKPRDRDLSHFMRLKLEASSRILEGLAIEDFDLIKQGAVQLNTMSNAEKWRVSNDALYRQFSGDFQRVTKELVEAAEKENLDRAALRWMDATMGCIECHRYARGIMIAGLPREGVLR